MSGPTGNQIWGCRAHLRSHSARIGITATLFFIIVAAIAFAFPQSISTRDQRSIRRILLFNDFGYMVSPGIVALDQAIVAALKQSPYQIEVYTEALESAVFSDEASQRRIRAWIALKYSDRKPDVIITAGPGFMIESHGRFSQSWVVDGQVAAKMAVRVLTGEELQSIPIVRNNSVYMFDWRALRHWGLRERILPAASTVLYRELSLLQSTESIWISGLLIILGLSALVAYLQFSRKELRLARDAQMQLSGRLIDAQEIERSRLAAELHDDFSQRLALLALGLENALEALPDSPRAAKQQLQELIDSVGELGADIHTVSHRLHSATLESLGLEPGVSSLCKEFGDRHGIEIDFSADNIPRVVDPNVALCLFRIVQEALQNLRKHSGSARAEVKLIKRGDRIFVSVCDQGKGFDMNDIKAHEGLGIRSMGERARSLRGSLEIHSKLGIGTRVEAAIPVPASRVNS